MKKYFSIYLLSLYCPLLFSAINIIAFYSKNVTEYLYLFDLTYAIGNSIHFVALSISDKGISVRDEVSGK